MENNITNNKDTNANHITTSQMRTQHAWPNKWIQRKSQSKLANSIPRSSHIDSQNMVWFCNGFPGRTVCHEVLDDNMETSWLILRRSGFIKHQNADLQHCVNFWVAYVFIVFSCSSPVPKTRIVYLFPSSITPASKRDDNSSSFFLGNLWRFRLFNR